MTATATMATRNLVMQSLNMASGSKLFVQTPEKENIMYRVVESKNDNPSIIFENLM